MSPHYFNLLLKPLITQFIISYVPTGWFIADIKEEQFADDICQLPEI
jgi:hypothetical protein